MSSYLISKDEIGIRDFEKKDLQDFKNFTPYEDILLTDYNLCFLSEKELKTWEKMIKNSKNRYFAVCLNDILIGYVAVKRISFLNSNYEMSLSLDAKYSSKGYGFKALKLFLPYYFEKIDRNSIWLNVNSSNDRAIKLYEKLGFRIISEFFGDFEVQNMRNIRRFEEKKDCFDIKNDIIYSKIYTMKLDNYTFMERWG